MGGLFYLARCRKKGLYVFSRVFYYLAGQGCVLHGAILDVGLWDKLQKSSWTVAFVWLF